MASYRNDLSFLPVSSRVVRLPGGVVGDGQPLGFFKTAKYQFGLASFGQQTLLGVYRWLILSFISFVLTHWIYLSSSFVALPDWKEAALLTLHQLLPAMAISLLLIEVESKRDLLASQGLALELVSLQI